MVQMLIFSEQAFEQWEGDDLHQLLAYGHGKTIGSVCCGFHSPKWALIARDSMPHMQLTWAVNTYDFQKHHLPLISLSQWGLDMFLINSPALTGLLLYGDVGLLR